MNLYTDPLEEIGVDFLTGLQALGSFEARLGAEVARVRRHGGQLALALIDLDSLEKLNRRHSRTVGDDVLRSVARCLSQVRGEDAAFRIGEDEFAIIFVAVGLNGARAAMRRLDAAVRADEGCRRIGLSWGLAALTGGDPAVLVASAGSQLLRVKRTRARRPSSVGPAMTAPSAAESAIIRQLAAS
jgi:diguanylate cyclase (GGDEF)-like protein